MAPVPPATKIRTSRRLAPVRCRAAPLAGWGGERAQRLPGCAARGGTRTRPAARGSAGGTATPGPRRPSCRSIRRRRPGPARRRRRGRRRRWRRGSTASERLSTFNTSQLVDDELRMVPMARVAVVMPAIYYLVTLVLQRVNADQLRAVGHQFRVDWHDAQNGITPPPYHGPSGYSPRQPHRRRAHRRRGDRGLHLAAPGGLGRAGARASHPAARPPGASVRGSCRSSTCGCPTPPSATASRRTTRTGRACCTGGSPGSSAAFLSTAAGACALFSTGRPWWCRSPPRWPASPSSPGRRASCTAIAAAHREAMAPHDPGRRGIAGLNRVRDRPGPGQRHPSLHQLFTRRLRSCCRTFTWPGYVPGSG